MSLRPGDAVEHFVIVSMLGQGGMGQVYVARDTRLQRQVALKIVQPEPEGAVSAPGGSGGAARLLREAQAAAALEHPNVVTIYEVGEIKGEGDEAGRPFIAMELVKGRQLRAFIGDESIALGVRIRWLVDIARALGVAHRAGLVHRDMKPENVMVRDDGVIKVLDFGVAKRAASPSASSTTSTEAQVLPSLTAKGVAVGTPYYMAPEQMRREPLDGRADQFAWGVVAYELISGEPVWGRDVDALELVSKLLTEHPIPLVEARPGVPANVSAVIDRALAKKRGDRFATMDEVIAALEETDERTEREKGVAFAPTMPRISLAPPSADSSAASHAPTESLAAPLPRKKRWPLVASVIAAAIAASSFAGIAFWKRGAPTTAPIASNASPVAPARECAKRSECTAKLGTPAVCNAAGRCAALASEDCETRADPMALASEDTVWFGTMFPKGDPDFDVELRAVDLARQDFAQMMSGYAREQGTHVHPLALIACDDAKDAMRAARHLVDDVNVPAILGFQSAAEVVDLGSALLIPHGVMGIVTLSTSPLVTALPNPPGQPRMIWRTTYSSAETAKALGHLVPEIVEPRMRAAGLGPRAPMRVAYVRDPVRGGLTFDELLFTSLRFNGKSALDNGSDYRQLVLDTGTNKEDAEASLAESLARFAPQAIVIMVGSPAGVHLIDRLEARWPATKPRPVYLSPSTFGDDVVRWAGRTPDRRQRFLGLTPLPSTSVNARFVMHFNEGASAPVTRADAPNSDYDAFYLLAYATYAVGDGAITGASIARTIPRLIPPGKTIDVGPANIFDAFSTLRRGQSVDLNGALGSLDFNVETGEAPLDHAVLCVNADDEGLARNVESGVVFRSAQDRLEGELRCP